MYSRNLQTSPVSHLKCLHTSLYSLHTPLVCPSSLVCTSLFCNLHSSAVRAFFLVCTHTLHNLINSSLKCMKPLVFIYSIPQFASYFRQLVFLDTFAQVIQHPISFKRASSYIITFLCHKVFSLCFGCGQMRSRFPLTACPESPPPSPPQFPYCHLPTFLSSPLNRFLLQQCGQTHLAPLSPAPL